MKKQAEGLATEYNRLADQLNVSAFVFVLKPDLPKKKNFFFLIVLIFLGCRGQEQWSQQQGVQQEGQVGGHSKRK